MPVSCAATDTKKGTQRLGTYPVLCWLGVCICVGAMGNCVQERVIYRRPMLSGLPGAVSGGEEVAAKPKGYMDPSQIDSGKITIENPDGSTTLIARSARHLMAHIYNTLRHDDRDLFTEQVLSKLTKDEYRSHAKDPGAAFDELKARQDDVEALFARMPMGEYTPGILRHNEGAGVMRVALSPHAAEGLRWRGLDMVMEGGNWRLRWFVPNH